jgi:hypothetical protein
MSDPSFEARVQRLFSEHPHYPDAPLFAAEVEHRLSRGWALRRVLIGAAGVAGGLIAVAQIAGAGVVGRFGAADRLARDTASALHTSAARIPGPIGGVGQLILPFGGEVLWLVAGLAVLAAALLFSRSIREI